MLSVVLVVLLFFLQFPHWGFFSPWCVYLIRVSNAVQLMYAQSAPSPSLTKLFFPLCLFLHQAQNRFKVPLGTKFYRVKAVPWNRKV